MMTAADWCAVMSGLDVLDEDEACAAYADWLEEQGLPGPAAAARRLPSLVGLVSDALENYVEWRWVDFTRSRKQFGWGAQSPSGWLYAWRFGWSDRYHPSSWGEHLACGLIASGAWHYPMPHPTIAAVAYVERMLPLACASVFGADADGDVRARFRRGT